MNAGLTKIKIIGEIIISLPVLLAKAVYLGLIGFLVLVKGVLPLSK